MPPPQRLTTLNAASRYSLSVADAMLWPHTVSSYSIVPSVMKVLPSLTAADDRDDVEAALEQDMCCTGETVPPGGGGAGAPSPVLALYARVPARLKPSSAPSPELRLYASGPSSRSEEVARWSVPCRSRSRQAYRNLGSQPSSSSPPPSSAASEGLIGC